MTLQKSLIGLFITSGLSYASSLAVYQDKTFYSYTPSTSFIGFTKGITAKCEGRSIGLRTSMSCPPEDRLCKDVETLDRLENKQNVIVYNGSLLEKFVSLPQPQTIDASSWIAAAEMLAEKKASIYQTQEKIIKERKILENRFKKQAPVKEALETEATCSTDLELILPYGYVSFSTSYIADLEEKELTVTQNLSILNRSGLDIEADMAMFYYKSAQQYVNPVHFTPWVVSKYVPRAQKKYKSAKRTMMVEESLMAADSVMAMAVPAPVASYEDAREYKINNLNLPSTGLPLEVKVLSWKAALECEVKAYPYRNTKAFYVCSFTPKYQIDSNTWKVKSGNEMINERAVGEYRKEKYNIYTKVEEDIQILRRPIVKKERQTGIFGGTARKQDGFTLTLTNKSSKEKKFTLIERIPTSTTTEIKSKLLSIKSAKKVAYKMLKDGKIEMSITLSANQTQKIDVLFEITYDKDLKVNY
jgi:hypothetical protein